MCACSTRQDKERESAPSGNECALRLVEHTGEEGGTWTIIIHHNDNFTSKRIHDGWATVPGQVWTASRNMERRREWIFVLLIGLFMRHRSRR